MASTIVVDKIQKTSGVAFELPIADGQAGQSLQTDGSLGLSWGSVDPIIAKGGDIASAAPCVIPDGNLYYDVTGTTGFSAFTVTAGRHFILQFDGALTMTHHADNLDLPGEDDILTVAGDVAEFVATATNKAHCINYTRATGKAVVESVALTEDQSWSGSQRGTPQIITDGTIDLDTGNNFQYTPATNPDTLEFSNEEIGQTGFIQVINASGKTIALGSEVRKGASWDVSTAGTYLVTYYCDGTLVWLSASEALVA